MGQLLLGVITLVVGILLAVQANTIVSQSAGNFSGVGAAMWTILELVVPLIPVGIGVGLIYGAVKGG
jgi:hypothetical protein